MNRLPATTPEGIARTAALAAVDMNESPAAKSADPGVGYRSDGRVAIIGGLDEAGTIAERIGERLESTIIAPPADEDLASSPASPPGKRIIFADVRTVDGYLGQFRLTGGSDEAPLPIAPSPLTADRPFDIVIDLRMEPARKEALLPPGYFAPTDNAEALERAITDASELVGEFEKPRYFAYDASICAHGASGIGGCTRCLDACPASAISSSGERIEVDPHLCQGAGVCATACPTGAITYAWPKAQDLLSTIRTALKAYREADGKHPAILFHDQEIGAERWAQKATTAPEFLIPLPVEEIGSAGMDAWSACIAWGAQAILLIPSQTPPSVQREIAHQAGILHRLLEAMGYPASQLTIIETLDDIENIPPGAKSDEPEPDQTQKDPNMAFPPPATFAPIGEKRTDIRFALDHLHEHAPTKPRSVELPLGSPFGHVSVDSKACTLCMGCVSVCPASALQAGGDEPRLSFIEANCVQCGLCESACPESCIHPSPRYLFDREERRHLRTLNEDRPFHCIECGKIFGTFSLIMRMQQRLSTHSMFQAPGALDRLQMCEDCRVKDLFRNEAKGKAH
ncbi:4Fe-4S binding protein [Thioalkalivibrio sp. HK1]|uniref:4Fe-4S binding protein n=1 Tax=Thioalkalivibrio sp. HK1 TaxID=1469245 RepID=UPI0004728DB0|nr:4Fe-4S binding protein [Thioalkalivibrio sp. HK1]